MKRINWKHAAMLLGLIICIGIVVHDIFVISVLCYFTSKLYSFTLYGITTFLVALFIGVTLWQHIESCLK